MLPCFAAVLPGKVDDTAPPPVNSLQVQQEALISLLNKTENEEDKVTIRDLLNKL